MKKLVFVLLALAFVVACNDLMKQTAPSAVPPSTAGSGGTLRPQSGEIVGNQSVHVMIGGVEQQHFAGKPTVYHVSLRYSSRMAAVLSALRSAWNTAEVRKGVYVTTVDVPFIERATPNENGPGEVAWTAVR